VVAAGSSPEAQALIGRTVALLGGAMYAQYRAVPLAQCLPLPDGTKAAEGASCFVNPLTALGMVETMRREGHKALVHTAAASNLGQMLNRICLEDGIELVNIVRKKEQEELLRAAGAHHVCNNADPDSWPAHRCAGFMAWGMGGWLLLNFLQKIGPEGQQKLKARVAAGLKTTFASHYTREISLLQALSLDVIAACSKQATGEKFLLNPNA